MENSRGKELPLSNNEVMSSRISSQLSNVPLQSAVQHVSQASLSNDAFAGRVISILPSHDPMTDVQVKSNTSFHISQWEFG